MKKFLKCYFVLHILFVHSYSQTSHLQGNIKTDSIQVSYALITFTDEDNSSNTFTALSDTAGNYQLDIITSVKTKRTIIPETIELAQNYPNPFSFETEIPYKLNKQSDVSIKIYDILGQEVRTFEIGVQSNGIYGVKWDGRNDFGIKVAAGIYLYRLITQKESITKKIVFLNDVTTLSGHFNGNLSFPGENLEKKGNNQIDSAKYTVRIINTDSTQPKISTHEFYNVTLKGDTTLNFAVDEATHYNMNLYVGNRGYDQIFIVDTDSNIITDTLIGFRSVGNVVATRSGEKLYVTTSSYSPFPHDTTYPATVYSVDMSTKQKKEILIRRAMISIEPNGIPLIIASSTLQDTGLVQDTMRLVGTIDTLTDEISFLDTLDIMSGGLSATSYESLVFNPKETIFYTFTNQSQLFGYDYQERKIVQYYSSLYQPYHMVISADGKYIYCAGGPVLNVVQGSIIGNIPGNILGSLALIPNGKYLYLTDPGKYIIPEPPPSGHISMFKANLNGTVNYIGFVDVNKASGQAFTITDQIIIMPDGKKAYVTDSIANIFVLDLEKNEVVNVIRFVPHNVGVRQLSLGPK